MLRRYRSITERAEDQAISPFADPFDGAGELGELMKRYDWARTKLGPVEGWSQALRTALRLCLGTRFCCAIYWGPEHLALYNNAFCSTIVGANHPSALAQPAAAIWPEIFDLIGPHMEKCLRTGATLGADDILFPMSRAGFVEECYISFSYAPLINEFDQIEGVFATLVDTSTRVIDERRLRTLQSLGSSGRHGNCVKSTLAITAETISHNPNDIPFASIYLWDEQRGEARLCALSNIQEGTPVSPTIVRCGERGPLAELTESGDDGPVVSKVECALAIPRDAPWRVSPRHMVRLRISSRGENAPEGFMIAGVNPHAPLDKDYFNFLQMLADQVSRFIAESHAREQEEARAKKLADLDRAKTAFFSNVSHELRTPLTLMLGPLEDILEEGAASLSAEQRGALGTVKRNGLRLLKLVNALLDLARMQADCLPARFEPTNLTRLTTQLVTSFEWAAKKAGIRLTVDCEELQEAVYVDPDMWQKIVLNLVSNAFKYTLNGEIRVTLRNADGTAELTVRDTGVGIAEKELRRIFERFYRVGQAAGRTREGAGIGLALVQELVRQHGGTVTVESVVERGSIFTVTVPCGSAHLPRQNISEGGAASPTRLGADMYVEEVCGWVSDGALSYAQLHSDIGRLTTLASAQHRLGLRRKKRVLLADDNSEMREYVSHVLHDEFEVEAVAHGRAALSAARRERPDLVIADVMMPQLDGFGLLMELRADPATRPIPVILLTAQAADDSKIQGLERGADDYLIKPFNARELLARANATIRLAQIREEVAQQDERVRIARELHDTVLQSVQGACLLLQVGLEKVGSEQQSSTQLFQSALEASLQAIAEGRKVLSLLRSSVPAGNDLVECLFGLGKELIIDTKVKFLVDVTGSRRELSPYAWTEVYRICREAITNAARHSGASQINVRLSYHSDLELSIIDDGCGIASSGRDGHFGLQGMHERSESLQGRLEVEGRPGHGTRIGLTVPGAVAYGD